MFTSLVRCGIDGHESERLGGNKLVAVAVRMATVSEKLICFNLGFKVFTRVLSSYSVEINSKLKQCLLYENIFFFNNTFIFQFLFKLTVIIRAKIQDVKRIIDQVPRIFQNCLLPLICYQSLNNIINI